MRRGYILMLTLSLAVTGLSVASLAYIVTAEPDYLRSDRDGVPFYTPKVINPEGGEPLSMGELIRHFKGE